MCRKSRFINTTAVRSLVKLTAEHCPHGTPPLSEARPMVHETHYAGKSVVKQFNKTSTATTVHIDTQR